MKETISYTFSDLGGGEARSTKSTHNMFKQWRTFCKEDPSYSVYCLDFLGDVIVELQHEYEKFSKF